MRLKLRGTRFFHETFPNRQSFFQHEFPLLRGAAFHNHVELGLDFWRASTPEHLLSDNIRFTKIGAGEQEIDREKQSVEQKRQRFGKAATFWDILA